jgi:AcrR family transcriptional regulator
MEQSHVKERLLASALHLLADNSYDSVSVEKVREDAGVSNGSFFHFFNNKNELAAELLVACVADYQKSILAALRGTRGASDGISAIITEHLRWVQKNRTKGRFMLDEARAAWFSLAAGRLRTANQEQLGRLETWRLPLVRRGELHDIPREVFGSILIGPANTLCRMWLTELQPSLTPPMKHRDDLIKAARRALIPERRPRK